MLTKNRRKSLAMQRNISFRVGKNLVHHDNHLPRWMHIFRAVYSLTRFLNNAINVTWIPGLYIDCEKNMDNYKIITKE